MSNPTIHPARHRPHVVVSPARERTTARHDGGPSFGDVLASGADVVLRGVETAAHAVGGPLMSGAVRSGRVALTGGGAAEDGAFDQVRALQEQAQAFNLEYLALQEEVQQQNRQFTTLSNVSKARHETARAILQNLR